MVNKIYRRWIFAFVFFIGIGSVFLIACAQQGKGQIIDGPYFGNGLRNGWVDQHSISIWTRLTKLADLNKSGIHFRGLSSEEHRALQEQTDVERIHSAQIPAGYDIADMDASCPGAPGQVRLIYHIKDNLEEAIILDWQEVDSTKNFTIQWKLEDLMPNALYQLQLLARAEVNQLPSDTLYGFFRTPPDQSEVDDIKFAVVTGHDYNRRDNFENGHQIYHSMLQDSLDFYAHTGDIEYYDKPNPWAMTEAMMYYKWDRLFALPFQRNFYRQTTSYFLKDDHDALRNDCFAGMTYGSVSFERGLEIFDEEQFPSNDSLYKKIRWGNDLEIWLVEGRNYRSKNTDPDGPQKTIWGKQQKEWLFRTIRESDATYKVIISSTPILGPDRGNKNDNYANAGFTYEGNEIRDFINQFDNVFICVGDRHWQYVSHRANTNLWEFSCGPGSDEHAGGWSQENKTPDHQFLRVKGGYLVGKVFREGDNARIRFEHRDVEGQIVHEETFPR